MTDNPTTDATPTAPAQEPPQPEPAEIDWKAKARDWEAKAKANKTAADELASIKESQKSEAQKQADRIAALEATATAARNEALRYRIANEFTLSAEDAAALEHVTSEDGMRLVAQRLSARVAEQKKNGNHVPREGGTPASSDASAQEVVRGLFGG